MSPLFLSPLFLSPLFLSPLCLSPLFIYCVSNIINKIPMSKCLYSLILFVFLIIEYPAARGGKPEDKQNYIALLRELKEAFQPYGYLLTAAVSAGKWFIDPAYDIPQVSQ